MAEVASWYSEQLNGLAGAKRATTSSARGIDAATAERFGLGLAPDNRTALKRTLASSAKTSSSRPGC